MKLDWQAIGESIWKYKVYIGLAILIIGLPLFLWQCGSNYFFKRDIDKKKEAVNATLDQIKAVNANIAAEKKTAEELAANLKRDTNAYLEATNTTDATRSNVNAAIERMKQAANQHGNVNSTQLEEILKNL